MIRRWRVRMAPRAYRWSGERAQAPGVDVELVAPVLVGDELRVRRTPRLGGGVELVADPPIDDTQPAEDGLELLHVAAGHESLTGGLVTEDDLLGTERRHRRRPVGTHGPRRRRGAAGSARDARRASPATRPATRTAAAARRAATPERRVGRAAAARCARRSGARAIEFSSSAGVDSSRSGPSRNASVPSSTASADSYLNADAKRSVRSTIRLRSAPAR